MENLVLDNIEYPVREIRLREYEVNVLVGNESLENAIYTEDDEYTSRDAQLLAQIIYTFVPDDLFEKSTDEELEEYIVDHLVWV